MIRLSTGSFRNRGLRVVIDTTREAEFDFALHRITEDRLGSIAEHLRALPVSKKDRAVGNIRVREISQDWEIAFVISHEHNTVAILILGLDAVGQIESNLEFLARIALAGLPRSVQELLKPRKKNP